MIVVEGEINPHKQDSGGSREREGQEKSMITTRIGTQLYNYGIKKK